ncbi:TatD family hydrolase [Ferrimonas marina]|uniref:TatD DNase family protein n=1 Tax=Ferrimonas marina TaxID=299255 RepID=A0A1M5V9S1_9GAMM|nr:TatD family hydrolase [Ferrimonas marina]SHH71976.1 TatD DNase family protein [Ferrimonas marina]
MSNLIDSHCHLDLAPLYSQWQTVLARAQAVGVSHCIVPAVDRAGWPRLEALAEHSGVSAAIGLHPCFAHADGDVEAMTARLAGPHPYLAIGECGLDGVAGSEPMAAQQQRCLAQLKLAQQHELPVLLHVRKAHNELLQLLNRVSLPAGGILHGFSGSLDLARQYLRHNLKLGIGGVISYPRAQKTRQTVAQLPLSAMVLETDSPDMPLCGYQGQANEPAQLPKVLAALAELRSEPSEQLAPTLLHNLHQLFPTLQPR